MDNFYVYASFASDSMGRAQQLWFHQSALVQQLHKMQYFPQYLHTELVGVCVLTGLQATSGSRQEVELAPTDSLFGEASRIAVAEACVQALQQECTDNRVYAIASVEGDGPGEDAAKWQQLFTACYPTAAKTAKSSVPA